MKYVIFLLLVQFALASAQLKPDDQEWQDYKNKYGKNYDTHEEDSMRRSIFNTSKQVISDYNLREPDHRLAPNHLSDLTEKELRMRKGYYWSYRSSKNSLKAKRFIDKILAHNSLTRPYVDWREVPNRVSRVKDQGACGSSWAFAITGLLEGQEVIGKRTKRLVELSEQQLIDCTEKGCQGKSVDHWLESPSGFASEQSYPYKAEKGQCKENIADIVMTTSEPGFLPEGDETLKKFVDLYGPVAAAIHTSCYFRHHKSGIYKYKCTDEKPDHAVLVVGYGSNDKEGDYWIVKNSWGRDWGEEGYIRIERNNSNCSFLFDAKIAVQDHFIIP